MPAVWQGSFYYFVYSLFSKQLKNYAQKYCCANIIGKRPAKQRVVYKSAYNGTEKG